MIAYLRGTVLEKAGGTVIVMAGGVGYKVEVPISSYAGLPAAGQEVNLRIYTKVSEDSIALFGFLTAIEKRAFERLISVSGIGPALGVKVLSGIAVENLVSCIRGGDIVGLTRVPGIGKKTAERIILELKDKLDDLPLGAPTRLPGTTAEHFSALEADVLSALINLGSPAAAAEQAVAKAKGMVNSGDFEALFRKSLELVR
ncbi:Holliday junction branch migration protein RuvA [Bryobacter aggregatus]|uniref:Holliday junction branch migration protein RuvA n=1 Tax=Bryobacter aggregatus TaxID=360054 RepID=UPI0004E23565|nr:Holliday junction branch migration protein RuvA [Bryobacter aggregatus]